MPFLQGLFGPPNIEKLKAKNDLNGLVKALTYEKDPAVSQSAADALVSIGASAVEPLAATLKGKDLKLCEATTKVLDRLGWQAPDGQMATYYWIAKQQWDKCVEIGAPAVFPLIDALERNIAIDAIVMTLSQVGTPAIEPLVSKLIKLGGNEPAIRNAIENALIKIGKPGADALILSLQNKNTICFGAIDALGLMREARAVEPFGMILNDKGLEHTHSAVVTALGRIGSTQAIDQLINTSFNRPDIGIGSAMTVAKIGPSASEQLVIALSSNEDLVRMNAVIALGEMGSMAVEPIVAATKKNGIDTSKIAATLSKMTNEVAKGIGAIRNEKWYHDKYEETYRTSTVRLAYSTYRYRDIQQLSVIDPGVIALIAIYRGAPNSIADAIQKALASLA
jgi:HEAT repeat protein